MTLPVIFHELAENELNEAAAFYAQARPGLGEAFADEVQRAMPPNCAMPPQVIATASSECRRRAPV